jgi:hypothetical protein
VQRVGFWLARRVDEDTAGPQGTEAERWYWRQQRNRALTDVELRRRMEQVLPAL